VPEHEPREQGAQQALEPDGLREPEQDVPPERDAALQLDEPPQPDALPDAEREPDALRAVVAEAVRPPAVGTDCAATVPDALLQQDVAPAEACSAAAPAHAVFQAELPPVGPRSGLAARAAVGSVRVSPVAGLQPVTDEQL
jgi:hypothetical protein